MTVTADAAAVLANAAFGDDPGRWPLPPAAGADQLWLRAVAAGGQGRYASAVADLAAMLRVSPGGRLASLAHSARASFVRQLGWHTRARTLDGRAAALAGADPEAGVDALIGLAADALGVGRFTASARLLQQAGEFAVDASGRLPIRLAWVSAELAMATGDGAAVRHAQHAVDLAAAFGSARHAVKSDVILAAALCSAGAIEDSRRVADAALQAASQRDLIPLRWALACLLVEIGTEDTAAQLVGLRDACADTVRRRGGVWSRR